MSGLGTDASAIRLNNEQEQHLAGLTSATEIQEYLHRLAQEQELVKPDIYSGDLLATEKGLNAPRTVSKVLVINQTRYELTAENEQALQAKELDLYRALEQQTTEQEQPRDQETGRFISAEEQAQDAAVAAFLARRGLTPEVIDEMAGKSFTRDWETATRDYLHSPDGANWPGGERNKEIIGEIITTNGWLDAEDKAAALAAAVNYARDNNLLVVNPETETAQKIGEAKTFQEVQAALGRTSSSVFGYGYGR